MELLSDNIGIFFCLIGLIWFRSWPVDEMTWIRIFPSKVRLIDWEPIDNRIQKHGKKPEFMSGRYLTPSFWKGNTMKHHKTNYYLTYLLGMCKNHSQGPGPGEGLFLRKRETLDISLRRISRCWTCSCNRLVWKTWHLPGLNGSPKRFRRWVPVIRRLYYSQCVEELATSSSPFVKDGFLLVLLAVLSLTLNCVQLSLTFSLSRRVSAEECGGGERGMPQHSRRGVWCDARCKSYFSMTLHNNSKHVYILHVLQPKKCRKALGGIRLPPVCHGAARNQCLWPQKGQAWLPARDVRLSVFQIWAIATAAHRLQKNINCIFPHKTLWFKTGHLKNPGLVSSEKSRPNTSCFSPGFFFPFEPNPNETSPRHSGAHPLFAPESKPALGFKLPPYLDAPLFDAVAKMLNPLAKSKGRGGLRSLGLFLGRLARCLCDTIFSEIAWDLKYGSCMKPHYCTMMGCTINGGFKMF